MTDARQTQQIAEILLTVGAIFPQGPVADPLTRKLRSAPVAAHAVTGLERLILPTVFGSTVLFESIGPIGTRFALRRAGEV
jgi:hypothetical protein